jgi:ABC-type multidrug transport system permease subunit
MPTPGAEPRPLTGPARWRWALADTLTITGYNLRRTLYQPEKLLDVTLQPVILVLLFVYIFGTAIQLPGGGDYREFLIPGICAYSVLLATIASASAVAELRGQGLLDRLRALPMEPPAVLLGQTLSDLLERLLALAITIGCGLLIGWRPHTGLGPALAALGLLLLFSLAMLWVGVWVGLLIRSVETAASLGVTLLLPLAFISNTFVPTTGMPAWLRGVAEWNPLSAAVTAGRLLLGSPGVDLTTAAWPLHHAVAVSLGWSLLLLVTFAALAIRRYRSVTAR